MINESLQGDLRENLAELDASRFRDPVLRGTNPYAAFGNNPLRYGDRVRGLEPSLRPRAILERVDILDQGSDGLYGAKSVAGVVNVTTRRNFEGFESRTTRTAYKFAFAPSSLSDAIGEERGSLYRGGLLPALSTLDFATGDDDESPLPDLGAEIPTRYLLRGRGERGSRREPVINLRLKPLLEY